MTIRPLLEAVRSALFLPASNARAVEKARGLDCDLAILDLEDSVKEADKAAARETAAGAGELEWRPPLLAVRINPAGSPGHMADLGVLRGAAIDLVVIPKVESAAQAMDVSTALQLPVLAMIETPKGVFASREIAQAPDVAGLIVGSNDLAAGLRLRPGAARSGLSLSLQAVVLAARAGGGIVLDGVYNRLDDPDGFAAECAEGRALGFDGKTLIHPNQIETANRIFGPSAEEIEDAAALIEAHGGGAERFRGRMIEAMHVAEAHRLLARAGQRADATL